MDALAGQNLSSKYGPEKKLIIATKLYNGQFS